MLEPVSRGFPARPRRHRRGPGGLLQHQEVLRVSEGLEDHARRRPAEHRLQRAAECSLPHQGHGVKGWLDNVYITL